MSKPDIVIVSDRAPVTFVERDSRFQAEAGRGSVTTILAEAGASVEARVDWVSVTSVDADARAARAGLFDDFGPGCSIRPVLVPADIHHQYYARVGVRMLWFALHELWDELPAVTYGPADHDSLRGFTEVNRLVAERVADVSGPGTAVLVNDYQLVLVPGLLRQVTDRRPVACFLHTPFAGPESMRRLPDPLFRTVLESLLSADLVGFQRHLWARRFLECCARAGFRVDAARGLVRGARGTTWVRRYPVAIAADEVAGVSESAPALARARDLEPGPGERLVVRVDRLDPAKNVLRGFQAFRLLLEREPELRGRVRLAAVLVPSREYVPEYAWYARRVWDCVERLRRAFPGSIEVQDRNDRERAMGALRVHDILLVNSLRDGMNVVVQEAAVAARRDGVVALSTGAGAHELLGRHAIPIARPRDVAGTADALSRALALDGRERRRRAEAMRAVVAGRSPARWLRQQLVDLEAVRRGAEPVSRWP